MGPLRQPTSSCITSSKAGKRRHREVSRPSPGGLRAWGVVGSTMHTSLAVKGISLLASVLDASDRRRIAGNPAGNGTGKLALHLKEQAPDAGCYSSTDTGTSAATRAPTSS